MLAPLWDYFCPKDPKTSPVLQITKEYYFSRLSVCVGPGLSGFEETKWITSEDTNIEHLLDIFTSIDTDSASVWTACYKLIKQLHWYKPRPVSLGPKIKALPDDHHFKPQCLYYLAWLSYTVGNSLECKQLLVHTLTLWRKCGFWNYRWVFLTLDCLSQVNQILGCYEEGVQQAKKC